MGPPFQFDSPVDRASPYTGGVADDMIFWLCLLVPPSVAMLIKTLVSLEGTGRLLNPRFSLMEVMQPFQRGHIGERGTTGSRQLHHHDLRRPLCRHRDRIALAASCDDGEARLPLEERRDALLQ